MICLKGSHWYERVLMAALFSFASFASDKTMINYSIVMRSVNANLFEINQAKSRIKAAEEPVKVLA